jgi:hypothetical protein
VAAPASGSRPFLHGVVLDGSNSRAYLEEPDAQRVLGYALGDAVAGGKLVRILDDRVVIRRPDGLQEIMLRDPAKPRPPARAGSGPVPLRRPPPLPRASAAGAATPAAPVPNAPAPSAEVSGQTTPPQGAR